MRTAVLVLVVAALVATTCTETAGNGDGERASGSTERPASVEATTTSTGSVPPSTTTIAADEPVAPLPVCLVDVGAHNSGSASSPAFEVLETHGAAYPDEWAGWSFWSDVPGGVRVFVTDRVDFHQAELAARLPAEITVEVVRTDRSSADLQPTTDRINQALDLDGASFRRGARTIVGLDRVSGERRTFVWIVTERADAVATEHIRSILDEADVVDETTAVCLAPHVGPIRPVIDQIQGGPGWRLLDEGISGPQGIDVATTEDGYRVLWTRARYETDRPPVEMADEVVIYVGGITGSCMDLYLTSVELQAADGQAAAGDPAERIEVVLERPLCGDGGELAVGVPHSYLLAIDRSLLAERVEVAVTNTAAPRTATELTVDLADGGDETTRLGDPRLDLTLVPDVTVVPGAEPRAWTVTVELVGAEPELWLNDVFEAGPPGSPSADIEALLSPRVHSGTVPLGTTAVTFATGVCSDGGCRNTDTCELPLDLAAFDHVAVDLTITTNGDCRLGELAPVP